MKLYPMRETGSSRLFLALVAAVAVGSAFAIDVRLTGNDNPPGVASFNTVGNWSSHAAPEPTNDYFTSGFILATPKNGGTLVFQGRSLTIDGMLWHVNSGETTVSNLIVAQGGYVYTVNSKGPLCGQMTLQSGVSLKWEDGGGTADTAELNMDIIGDATTAVYQEKRSASATRMKVLKFGGDLSAFLGTIYSHQPTSTVHVVFSAGKTSFPGKLEGTNGATVKIEIADGVAATVGSIDASDMQVTLGEGATLTVTGNVDFHGNPIRVTSPHEFTAAAETVPFVTFTTAPLSVSDVVIEGFKVAAETGLAHCPAALNLQTNVSDGTFSFSHRKVVYQTAADSKDVSSIFTGPGEARWSEQLTDSAAAETDYYLSQKTAYHPLSKSATFYGKSLTLAGGISGSDLVSGYLSTVKKCELTIDDFRWLAKGGDTVQISSYNGNVTLNGHITVLPSAKDVFFGWYQWNDNVATINSDIRGSGGIRLTCNQDASGNAKANFVLTGDNSAFTGRLLLMHKPFKAGTTPAGDPDNHFVTLKIAGQQNLGGALPAFDAESLSIEDNSLLQVTQSATFDEPTRGWQIRGHGRLAVPANAVVVVTNKTITYVADGVDAGRFSKEGAGTLVLGGAAVAETGSQLEVKEGTLRFASTTAADGLSVSFAAETALEVDLSATGELATKGVVNTSATPFAGASPIPLILTATGTLPDAPFDVAICTVSDTLKDALTFTYPAKFARLKMMVDHRDNGDGTVTFFVNAGKSGVLLLVR